MKKLNNINRPNLLKRIFIKICRKIGFEIIDQSIFYVPTQNKHLGDNLSIPGKKSITIPLGQSKISRKVEALTIIFRSCTNVNMLTQNKKRLFEKKKSEYTFRSLNSIISSLKIARQNFSQVKFNILVVDHNSNKNDLNKIKEILNKSSFKNSIISLNVNEFKNDIKKLNAKNEKVTENQISNMSNINKSFLLAKNQCEDLIYFVEDDYLHQTNTINEMLFTYERLSSQTGNEIILCPSDYPFLYTKLENTKIFLGSTRHWRTVDETLCTFLTSTIMLKKHWEKFISMCKYEHYPFEQPLHDIYKEEYCLSPIPTLSVHFTNVNSIFGISPNTNWKKIWDENEV